ncbi:MAG TPA: phospholipase [Microbacterium sp.]|uniref:aggregation-promoting factor C-terminal-like domain-containing protein n=1 Tax=Microbacterium sp. TaxID=51671 RepID=UPI002C6806EE|nr:phospholipase [Microbacterium sp.]HWI31961.1 phospholipase [Microbacterium sp.]
MLSRSTQTPARQSRLRGFAPLALGLGVTLGAATLTGFTIATPPAHAGEAVLPTVTTSRTIGMDGAVTGSAVVETITEITERAEDAIDNGRAAVDRVETIEADVAAAGLDLGAASTVIDTSDLRADIDRLASSAVMPLLLLPAATDDATAETAHVEALATSLRERLDAAQAQRAAEEAAAAAAQAAAEAAAQAQREAEAAAAALANANTVDGAKATAAQKASAEYGWGSDQFSCLVSLWNKESGWNYKAFNASSGATGIPQALPGSKMASAGSDWQSSASTQISWGLRYIASVYGTPCGAWGHSQSTGWY